jgi:eukaryotic-like serine/threonine-protein kinase
MTPQRWQSIELLFDQVADLPPAERARVLAAADAGLREEVERLLAADSRGAQAVTAAIEEGRDLLVPQRFGPYRVTALAGRGGMGAVFKAVRDDGAFQKQVAIKVMHTGLDGGRFRQERAILAALEHPHIARLLDGGETETGTSYIVLEYVDGVPLLEYCSREKRSTTVRLRLFLDICSAVQYAHQNLVVHRDLKPGNVLVTGDGTPKLLDFGIARLVDNDPGRTATMVQALTPHYASPEQVRGGAITAASDVYSLGVILYELLTGRRPYEFPSLTPAEIDKTVCDTEPAAPGLSDDLDNIILKALRKEPARRYASVQQLADDIERSLAHLPVLARPDTFRYRTAKFLRRNWYSLGAATLTLGAILAGSGVALYQAHVARQRFDQVRSLANRFLFDFEAQISDIPGTTKAREMVVATALEYLNRLASDAGGDPNLLDEIAQAYQKTAHVLWQPGFHGLGQAKDALETLEKPRAIYEQLLRGRPADDHLQRQLAMTQILISDLQNEVRRHQDAQANAQLALARVEQLLRRRPADAGLRRLQTRAWRAQGLALSLSGQSGAALDPLRRAASALESLSRDDPELHWGVLSMLGNLGDALERRGHLAEALSVYERSIIEGQEMWARDPNSAKVARMLLMHYRQKSGVLGNRERPNLGRRSDALAAAERSLEIARRLFQADQNNALAAHDYAIAQGKIADLLGEADPLRALELNRRAIAIVRSGAMGDYRERLSIAYPLSVAEPLRVLRRTAEASAGLREAEQIAKKLLAAAPEDVDLKMDFAAIYREMGDIENSLRNRTAAAAAYERARQVLETMARAKPDFIRLQYQLAELYKKLAGNAAGRDRDEELRWRRELVSVWRRWVDRTPDSPFGHEQLSEAESRLEPILRGNTPSRPAMAARKTRNP